MGVDLGIKELAVADYGNHKLTFHNINKSAKMRDLDKRIRSLQRSISRKYEANRIGDKYVKTKNISRAEEKLRHLYARQANIRRNYIHQVTHELVSMCPRRIVMEDLNVRNMIKNRHLSRSISSQYFYEFARQVQYKCEWNGIEFVKADRFFPSSKTCSCCGNIKHDLQLKDRLYKCDVCGIEIDRDYNAAINLSRYVA
jgi:putative transposase